MIAADQPDCFSEDILVRVSSRSDGTMLDRTQPDIHHESEVAHRRAFCARAGVAYDDCVYQIIDYDPANTYSKIVAVASPHPQGIYADALYTETAGVGLFLPVADCVATVVYDTKRQALALAHLGRHSSVAKLMTKLIDDMTSKGSRPDDLIIWMAPSVASSDYRMRYFDHMSDPDWQGYAVQADDGVHLDLPGYNASLARRAGVGRIGISPVNTAHSPDYFSHSQGDASGRFAVLAIITES